MTTALQTGCGAAQLRITHAMLRASHLSQQISSRPSCTLARSRPRMASCCSWVHPDAAACTSSSTWAGYCSMYARILGMSSKRTVVFPAYAASCQARRSQARQCLQTRRGGETERHPKACACLGPHGHQK